MDNGNDNMIQMDAPPPPEDSGNKKPGNGKKIAIITALSVIAAAILLVILFATHIICIQHDWQDATCLAPEICSKCGRTQGEALGHSWKNATCTSPETCSRCHEEKGDPLGHDWQAATCTNPETCARCKKTQGTALGHDAGDWKTIKTATLNSSGTEERTCKNCGETVDSKTVYKTPAVSSQSFNFTEEEFFEYLSDHTSSSYKFVNALPDSVKGIGDSLHGYIVMKDGTFDGSIIFVRNDKAGNVMGFLVDSSDKTDSYVFAVHIANLISSECDTEKMLLHLTINNYCTAEGMELSSGKSELLGDGYYSTIIIPEGLTN